MFSQLINRFFGHTPVYKADMPSIRIETMSKEEYLITHHSFTALDLFYDLINRKNTESLQSRFPDKACTELTNKQHF